MLYWENMLNNYRKRTAEEQKNMLKTREEVISFWLTNFPNHAKTEQDVEYNLREQGGIDGWLKMHTRQATSSIERLNNFVSKVEAYGPIDKTLQSQGYSGSLVKEFPNYHFEIREGMDYLRLCLSLNYTDLEIPFNFNRDGEYSPIIDFKEEIHLTPENITDMSKLEQELIEKCTKELMNLPNKFFKENTNESNPLSKKG